MNKSVMVLIIIFSCSCAFSQEKNDENIYVKAFTLYVESLAGNLKDTLIIQKEDYFSGELPNSINNHTIKYCSEKEISNNDVKGGGFIKVFPAEVKDDILTIGIVFYGYSKLDKIWVRFGSNYIKFKFNCENRQFKFFEQIDYGI